MKIQCDVCNKEEATVYCSADEAALCSGCDNRVHHANKLAGKHDRFSLIQPLPKQFPLCDICQEKRAFLFCQQDRAILCKTCDIPIHKANEHTQKHNRFLFTGVKLSATSTLYSPPTSSTTSSLNSELVPNKPINKPASAQFVRNFVPPRIETNSEKAPLYNSNNQMTSVSEYLMEMPGWHVEDLLDSSSPATYGLCKTGEIDLAIWEADLGSNLSSMSSESNGIFVPQAPTPSYQFQCPSSNISFGAQVGYKGKDIKTNKSSKKRRLDDSSFTVPQISPQLPIPLSPLDPELIVTKSQSLINYCTTDMALNKRWFNRL